MENKDIRWHQRFDNYNKALMQLEKFIQKGDNLNELEEQGLIKVFEYTYELAWNVLKDFLQDQGNQNIFGSRDAIAEAFKLALIENGEGWMEMYADRNKTSHTYNQATADAIAKSILQKYYFLFKALQQKMESIKKNNSTT